jgi:hypothetical protein
LDTNDENIKTSKSHSEEIRAKLNRWKSYSKVDAKNTIDQFLTEKIELNDNHKKNSTEEFNETQMDGSSFEFIENIKDIDEAEKTVELKQEEDDEKIETFMDTSNCKNNEVTKMCSINPNDKNTKEYKLLENVAEKSDKEENYLHLKNEINMNSKDEYLYNQDTDNNLIKIETDISIEIDSSIAPKVRKCAVVDINIEQIRQRLKNLTTRVSEKQKIKTRFYATIDPSKNQQAESELCREITKDMFARVS